MGEKRLEATKDAILIFVEGRKEEYILKHSFDFPLSWKEDICSPHIVMVTGGAVRLLQPSRNYVFLSKFLGGTMWFWILWRLKHDWHELVGHQYVFENLDHGDKHH